MNEYTHKKTTYNDMDSEYHRARDRSLRALIIAWDRKSKYRARKLDKERMEIRHPGSEKKKKLTTALQGNAEPQWKERGYGGEQTREHPCSIPLLDRARAYSSSGLG